MRRELAWLYRRGLNGAMPWSDCTKAAHVLGLLARIIEATDIERRIEALEQGATAPPTRANGHDRRGLYG